MAARWLRGLLGGGTAAPGGQEPEADDGSRRVRATFRVTCRDEGDKEACRRVRSLMHDCIVADAEPGAPYHHTGFRVFSSTDDATRRMMELIKEAGADASRIRVWVES